MTFDKLRNEAIEAWYRSTQKIGLTLYLKRFMFLNKWRLGPGGENGISSTRVCDGSRGFRPYSR